MKTKKSEEMTLQLLTPDFSPSANYRLLAGSSLFLMGDIFLTYEFFSYTIPMALSYEMKRRLSVFGVLLTIIVGMVAYYFYSSYVPPSCTDRTLNRDEEGVDCGGNYCIPCLNKIKQPIVLWSRAFPTRPGFVDIGALVENSEQFLGARTLAYSIRLFDKKNTLIATRDGTSFLEPGERMLIFEANVPIQKRDPGLVVIEPVGREWIKKEPMPLSIKILRRELFLEADPPHVELDLKNESGTTYRNIEVSIIILSGDEALGVVRTVVDVMAINESKSLTVTWPEPISGVTGAQVLIRQGRPI